MSEQFVPEDVWLTRELLVDQWVPALESGFYTQAREVLNDGCGGFCCLGVLLDVLSSDAWEEDSWGEICWAVNLVDDDDGDYGSHYYSEVGLDAGLSGFLRDDFDYTIDWDFAAMQAAAVPFLGEAETAWQKIPSDLLMAVNDQFLGPNDYSAPLAVIKAGLHLD